MKLYVRFYLLVIALVFLAFQSCSKPGDDVTNQDTFIRFSIGDTEYYFENLITTRSVKQESTAGTARIYPENTPITLWIPLDVSKGAHEVTLDGKPTEYRVSFSADGMGFNSDFAKEGRIIIFHVSEQYVEGTFIAEVASSVSKEVVTLTDGRFRAYLN